MNVNYEGVGRTRPYTVQEKKTLFLYCYEAMLHGKFKASREFWGTAKGNGVTTRSPESLFNLYKAKIKPQFSSYYQLYITECAELETVANQTFNYDRAAIIKSTYTQFFTLPSSGNGLSSATSHPSTASSPYTTTTTPTHPQTPVTEAAVTTTTTTTAATVAAAAGQAAVDERPDGGGEAGGMDYCALWLDMLEKAGGRCGWWDAQGNVDDNISAVQSSEVVNGLSMRLNLPSVTVVRRLQQDRGKHSLHLGSRLLYSDS
eukprot:GHVQ01040529.1.p1 GENE.GHVQ01040529.1~~GHVQ01040529.1.p1  ORF type:complete len:260 (+),score=55.90 GHVQ01040529.1:132-911(+)